MAVTLTPVGEGRLEVILNGETIFDRRATGAYPTLPDVREYEDGRPGEGYRW